MTNIQSDAQSQLHRGTFGEGQAHPESFTGEDHVGTFAEGEAYPESYSGEDHVGTFAEGERRSDS